MRANPSKVTIMELDEMCKNAVQLAAEREKDLMEFYGQVARLMKRKAIQEVFQVFHEDISMRVDELEGLIGEDASCDLLATELQRDEAPRELGISRYLKEVDLKEDSDYQDVLTTALKRQERIIDFFNSVAAMTPVDEVATIFRSIRNEEATRLRELEEIYEDEILLEG
jgi:rubrerythrin